MAKQVFYLKEAAFKKKKIKVLDKEALQHEEHA